MRRVSLVKSHSISLSTLQAIIDRESELAVYGTFIMEISATEVDTKGNRGPSVFTEVTIIVTVSNPCLSHTVFKA